VPETKTASRFALLAPPPDGEPAKLPATLPATPPVEPAPMEPTGRALTPRQETFCGHYVIFGNAAYAAHIAGYSRRNARQQGSRLLTKAYIWNRIMELRAEIRARHCADADAFMIKLETIFRLGRDRDHLRPALRAVELQMRMAGLLDGPGGNVGGNTGGG